MDKTQTPIYDDAGQMIIVPGFNERESAVLLGALVAGNAREEGNDLLETPLGGEELQSYFTWVMEARSKRVQYQLITEGETEYSRRFLKEVRQAGGHVDSARIVREAWKERSRYQQMTDEERRQLWFRLCFAEEMLARILAGDMLPAYRDGELAFRLTDKGVELGKQQQRIMDERGCDAGEAWTYMIEDGMVPDLAAQGGSGGGA